MALTIFGKFGTVNGIGSIKKWSTTETQAVKSVRNSATLCGTLRSPGGSDWSGSYEADGGAPTVLPGESFSFDGFVGPTDGVAGNNGIHHTGTAIVESVTITWLYGEELSIMHSVEFGGNSALTKADAVADVDATDPVLGSLVGVALPFYDTVPTDITSVTQVQLTMTTSIGKYNNADSGGDARRNATGYFDWTATIAVQEKNDIIASNTDIVLLNLPIDTAGLKWEMGSAHVDKPSNFSVDVEGDGVIGHTINLGMQAGTYPGGVWTPSVIKKPGGTTIWP